MEENINPVQNVDVHKDIYTKTFLWMFLGLLATAFVSVFSYATGFTINFIEIWPVLLIVEVVVVIVFSLLLKKMPPSVVGVLFFVYAILNGVTLSTIFYVYNLSSIVIIFFAAAAIFGICAFYGKVTNRDLNKIGNILLVTLIVGVIISLINLFIGNSVVDIAVDWVILIVFFGITAWDMQKVRQLAESVNGSNDTLAIYCAMQLYLDFINIFLRLLQLFGSRKD